MRAFEMVVPMRSFARCITAGLVGLVLAATASPAAASVTIGQIGAPDAADCVSADWSQPTVSSGNSYVMPATGILTSWSHIAKSGPNQKLKMKVFRPVAGLTYTVVGQDVSRDLASGVLNTFATSIPVKAGDVLGLTTLAGDPGCAFGPPETYYFSTGDQANGGLVTFTASSAGGQRLNVSAVLEPTNTFSLGTTTRNKKKGTATVTATVPNPGEMTVAGTGIEGAAGAATAVAVAAGTVAVTIRAKGKKKKKLNRKGKVKVAPTITYTPTGGTALSQTPTLKLQKKRKKR